MSDDQKPYKYPIAELKKVIHKHLYLEDDRIVDILFATHIANRFDTDPLWLIVIAPPSSAKTELMRAFDGHPEFFFLSTMTPATFISGKNVKANEPPASLLPKIDGKTLAFKDFTTILSMRSEQQVEILAQLREIYDGQYSKAFGTGKVFNWKGKIGFFAACTNIYDRHYGVIGSMGDRFLLYRSPNNNNEKMGLAAQRNVGNESGMRQELRKAYARFLGQFENLESLTPVHDETIDRQIVYLACFCATARCPVERDYRDGHIDYDPEPEGTPRLVKQLTQIGMALAIVNGKQGIDEDTYEVVKKIGRDLVSSTRLKILRYLWEERAFEPDLFWKKTRDAAEGINKPTNTVKRILEDLMVVGALNRTRAGDHDTAAYRWQITQQMFDWMVKAEVFE